MKLPLPEKIPVSEICRGMGLPSHAEPDEATLALAEKAAALVLESAQPRMIWRQLPLAWDGDSPRIAAERWRDATSGCIWPGVTAASCWLLRWDRGRICCCAACRPGGWISRWRRTPRQAC